VLEFKAPEDGIYRVNVSDNVGSHGEACKYFLRIDRKRQLFAAYVTPSTLQMVEGGRVPLKITVQRYDNFTGEIKLKVKSPAGFRIIGIDTIPAGIDSAAFTLEYKSTNSNAAFDLELEASSGDITVPVIPGDEAMQAFAYTHINPAKRFPIRVKGRSQSFNWATDKTCYDIRPGEKLTLKIKSARFFTTADPDIYLSALDLPPWLQVIPGKNPTVKTKRIPGNKKQNHRLVPALEIVLQVSPDAAGKSTNQLFQLKFEYTDNSGGQGKSPNPGQPQGKKRIYRTQTFTLPAIQINVK
jgi:hypothetical protein